MFDGSAHQILRMITGAVEKNRNSEANDGDGEFVGVEKSDVVEGQKSLSARIPTRISKSLDAIHEDDINCLQISNEGRLLATGSADFRIKIFDSNSCMSIVCPIITHCNSSPFPFLVENIFTFTGSTQSVNSVNFSQHDEFLVAASTDNTASIWRQEVLANLISSHSLKFNSLETGRIRHVLTGHMGKVMSAAFTPDSHHLISGSHDRTLKIWDLNKGYCSKTLFTFSSPNDLTLLQTGGDVFASGHMDNSIRVWDGRSGTCVKELAGIHSQHVISLSCIHGDRALLSMSRDNTIKIIDSRTFNVVLVLEDQGFRISHNQARASSSSCASALEICYVTAGSQDGSIHVWNGLSGVHEKVLQPLEDRNRGQACAAVWNPIAGSQLYCAHIKQRSLDLWVPD